MKKVFVCSPCYSYASVLLLSFVRYLYVTRMRILVYPIRIYVTRIYSYVTCMLLVCIRMHPYVTRFRMYPCGVLVKK